MFLLRGSETSAKIQKSVNSLSLVTRLLTRRTSNISTTTNLPGSKEEEKAINVAYIQHRFLLRTYSMQVRFLAKVTNIKKEWTLFSRILRFRRDEGPKWG